MESSLAAQYQDLTGDVGFFLGYGRGDKNGDLAWSTQQQQSIDRCVKGGLRKVYFCGYDWSFLKPEAQVQLDSGKNTIALPDDFGGPEGQCTLTATTSILWYPLDFTGMGAVYRKQAEYPTTTGRPQLICVEPLKGTGGTQGQRFQLRIWPLADAAYTIKFQYYLLPDYLSGAFQYVYGGAQHAETFLEAALSVAEKILDDTAAVHDQEFTKLLAISKELDRRLKPQRLGYNADRSDHRQYDRRDVHWEARISYKGVVY